jgi:hypothetical protein
MNASRDLARLWRTGILRIVNLRNLAEPAVQTPSPSADRALAYVVIEAHNAWALFTRAFYLSCAFSAKRFSGGRVACKPFGKVSEINAIDQAVRRMKPKAKGGPPWSRREEPAWQTPHTLITMSQFLLFSNRGDISVALSYAPNVFPQLRDFRHFFSHRNPETESVALDHARAIGIPQPDRAAAMLRLAAPSRPQSLVLDWLDDLTSTMTLLCR